eukprot:TRINITY_DN6269_c0_g1_i2.p1 TRINITY_DN6269_c0_g1~~TRINITY_DN6269_c0_g1_i2.p1  ORF type:complete len:176 (-),score=47.70 TRINITY_DN6269_c0_g1_i2:127-654(-)
MGHFHFLTQIIRYFKLQERKLRKHRQNFEKLPDEDDLQPEGGPTPNFMSDLKKKSRKKGRKQLESSDSSDSDLEDIGFNKEKYEKMLIQDHSSDEDRQGDGSFDDGLFAAADEFSHLIEDGNCEEGENKKKRKQQHGSTSARNRKRKPSPKSTQRSKKHSNNSFRKQNFRKSFKK